MARLSGAYGISQGESTVLAPGMAARREKWWERTVALTIPYWLLAGWCVALWTQDRCGVSSIERLSTETVCMCRALKATEWCRYAFTHAIPSFACTVAQTMRMILGALLVCFLMWPPAITRSVPTILCSLC